MKHQYLLASWLWLSQTFAPPTTAETLTPLGSFERIVVSKSEHCYGTSLHLWRKEDQSLLGLLSQHAGLCGDQPCVLVTGQIENNDLSFQSQAPIQNQHYQFKGHLLEQQLHGKLNGESLTFERQTDAPEPLNLQSWCRFWSKVPRCQAVQPFCQTITP